MSDVMVQGLADLLLRLPDEPLGAGAVPSTPFEAALEKTTVLLERSPGLTLTASPSISISVFNAPEDRDPDGLVESAEGRATLRYALSGRLRGRSGKSLANAGFALSGEGLVRLLHDVSHDGKERLRAAVATDLAKGPRLALLPGHGTSLAPGERVAPAPAGALQAEATPSWSSLLATGLPVPAAPFGVPGPLPVKVEAGAKLRARVRAQEALLVAFTGREDGVDGVRVTVRLTERREAKTDAGVEVQIDPNAEDLQALASLVGEAFLGRPLALAREVLDRARGRSLDDETREVLADLLARLGGDDVLEGLAALDAKLEELQKGLSAAVEKAAKARIGLAFAWELRRLRETDVVLEATLTDEELGRFHGDLVRGKLDGLLRASLVEGGPRVSQWLSTKVDTTEAKRTVSLSLAPWFVALGTDTERVKSVDRADLAGRRRVAFEASRRYDGTFGGDRASWAVNLAGSSRSFQTDPRLVDAALSLSLVWVASRDSPSGEETRLDIDTAILWGALTPQNAEERSRAEDREAPDHRTLRVEVRFDDRALRATLRGLREEPSEDDAGALAAALPWLAASPYRRHVALRKAAYAPLWGYLPKHPRTKPQDLARLAAIVKGLNTLLH